MQPFELALKDTIRIGIRYGNKIKSMKNISLYYYNQKHGWTFLPSSMHSNRQIISSTLFSLDAITIMQDIEPPFIRKVFPETDLIELPTNHPIFHGKYDFPNGLPKIHEHDARPAKAYGIIVDGRLVCLYTFESDIGDGWEDAEVHNDSDHIRQKALQMGANILEYVFSN